MIAYKRKTRTWQKPPLGSMIDWSHPLAQGLVGCFLLNENGGLQIWDLVNKLSLPLDSGTVWGTASGGTGILHNAGSRGVHTLCPAPLLVNIPLTLLWQGWKIGTLSNFGPIFGIDCHDGGSSPFNACNISFNSSATGINCFNSATGGSNNHTYSFASNIPSTGRAQIGFIWGPQGTGGAGSYQIGYVNGLGGSGDSTQSSGLVTYASSKIRLGDDGGTNPNILSEFALIYNVAQSDQNMKWIFAEPYDYILTSMNTRYFFLPSVVTGGIKPVSMTANLDILTGNINN